MIWKTLIVDDETSARENVKALLKTYRADDEVLEAANAREALEIIEVHHPNLMFLDIEMPGQNGLELLKILQKKNPGIKVIFITAHSSHAIDALKCEAFDYILKPIDENEFRQTMERFAAKSGMNGASTTQQISKILEHLNREPIKIKTKKGLHVFDQDDIVFVASDSNYSEIIDKKGKKLMVSKTLARIQEMLPGCQFIRVGRSHIINKKYLLGTDRIGKHISLLINGEPTSLKSTLNDIRNLERQL
jgi:two-component system, LytTR family, response regulator